MKKSELRKLIKEEIKSLKFEQRELSDLQKKYQAFFFAKLEEYGVQTPAQIEGEEKKKEF